MALALSFSLRSWAQTPAQLPPLQRVVPPFTANKLAILAKLRQKDFAGLDAEFEQYQQAFEKNPLAELNEMLAFDSFATDDVSVGDLLAQWIKAKPKSFAARLARGGYLSWRGWRTRGNLLDSGAAPTQSNQMQNYFVRSADDLDDSAQT